MRLTRAADANTLSDVSDEELDMIRRGLLAFRNDREGPPMYPTEVHEDQLALRLALQIPEKAKR